MERFKWEEEKEKREKESLENHARLHKLFNEDRLSFEHERKRMINEVINSTKDEAQRERLRASQEAWDSKMRNAGSAHNRFVLAQLLFWKHIEEVWNPTMQQFNCILNNTSGQKV